MNTNIWAFHNISGPVPAARADWCMAISSDDQIWLHGGRILGILQIFMFFMISHATR